MKAPRSLVVDAHHHLWSYSPESHAWIDPKSMNAIARDFGVDELAETAASAGVDAVVSVQAEQSVEETARLLAFAETSPIIAGVVGWAPLASPDIASQLDALDHPRLKGIRHVVQDEPDDDFLLGSAFNAGVALLAERGLVYDILIYAQHLPVATRFVDRHPEQRFVLDHAAKPPIRTGDLGEWRRGIEEIARRQNVVCKVSGLVTEADWKSWSSTDLLPVWDVVLEAFGPHRMMFGSDWPVCLLACDYARWLQTVLEFASSLTEDERARLFGGVAVDVYGLSPSR